MSCHANRVRDLLKPDEHKCCSCSKGPRGPQGLKGPKGNEGQPGEDGLEGPRGNSGRPGDDSIPGLLAFGDFYTDLPNDSFSIPINQYDTIPFDETNFLFVGIGTTYITRLGSGNFELWPAVYRITFRVPTMGPGALEIENVPGSLTGSNQACEIANTVLFSPTSLTSISIFNPGPAFRIPTKSGSTPLTYSLVIECIQNLPTNVAS